MSGQNVWMCGMAAAVWGAGTVAGAASIEIVDSPLGVTEGAFSSEFEDSAFTQSSSRSESSTLTGEIIRGVDSISIESVDVNGRFVTTDPGVPSGADPIITLTGVDTPNRFVIDFDRAFDFELSQILDDNQSQFASFAFSFQRLDADGAVEETLASNRGSAEGIVSAFSAGGFEVIGGQALNSFEELSEFEFILSDGTVIPRFETFDPQDGIDPASFEGLTIQLSGQLPAGRYEIVSEGGRQGIGNRFSTSRTDGFTFSAQLVAEPETPTVVPTPSAALAGGIGLLGLMRRRRRA